MLLGGALACFEEAPQKDLMRVVWHLCHKTLVRISTSRNENKIDDVVQLLRSVLVVVGGESRYELLLNILRLAEVPLPQHVVLSSDTQRVSQEAREAILSALPVTYVMSLDVGPSQHLLVVLLQQSVASIESYAGAPGSGTISDLEGSGSVEIGCAIAILRASSGYLDSVGLLAQAGQSDAWRQVREPILTNIALGTALLRWISSLSDHIQVLLPPVEGVGGAAGSALNLHRLGRVEGLVSTLTALVQCLWSHPVPRAVQGILARVAKCCAETAFSVLSSQALCPVITDSGTKSAQAALVERVVTKLLLCVAATMKIIGSPSFSEKSIEVSLLFSTHHSFVLFHFHL